MSATVILGNKLRQYSDLVTNDGLRRQEGGTISANIALLRVFDTSIGKVRRGLGW